MSSDVSILRKDLEAISSSFTHTLHAQIAMWHPYRDQILKQAMNYGNQNVLSTAKAARAHIESRYDKDTADVFDYMLCVEAMLHMLETISALTVPEEVKQLILEQCSARRDDGLSQTYNPYALTTVEGVHHLKKCLLQRLPLGLYDFELTAIPRSNLWKCPLHEKPALVKYILFDMRGFGPVYGARLPKQVGSHLTEATVSDSYRLLAKVLKMNPTVKGHYSTAWYHDPAVAEINPRLRFLNELVLRNGGLIHKLETTPACIEDALFKSTTRQRLFAEGKYMPTYYARYWARDAMVTWAGV